MQMKTALLTSVLVTCGAAVAVADETSPVQNRTIAYVITKDHWAVQTTEEAKECPDGRNLGPREQYDVLFPKDGAERSVEETELMLEAQVWFPDLETDRFDYKQPVGKIVDGVNLDGKADANDYDSPDGEKGIDNQFYRAVGCTDAFRPGNALYDLHIHYYRFYNHTRMAIELTEVDSLVNDDDVVVNVYRGIDSMLTDSSGNEYLPYGTIRVDPRWGKEYRQEMRGKIVDGVLTTAPAEVKFPHQYYFDFFGIIRLRDAQLKLSLQPENARGVWGGYIDIESFYRATNGAMGTHSVAYGRMAMPSFYKAMYRLADAFPDPKTGKNTAISGAKALTLSQVFLIHPDKEVASEQLDQRAAAPVGEAARRR